MKRPCELKKTKVATNRLKIINNICIAETENSLVNPGAHEELLRSTFSH